MSYTRISFDSRLRQWSFDKGTNYRLDFARWKVISRMKSVAGLALQKRVPVPSDLYGRHFNGLPDRERWRHALTARRVLCDTRVSTDSADIAGHARVPGSKPATLARTIVSETSALSD